MSDQGLGDLELRKDKNNLITERWQCKNMPRSLAFKVV
ncbi:hypothetical protein SynMITS9220_03087 [Synechococcus sp. MIT S9220]|nr:hypothetical protein SynMITS9220_03087 [Synechococcus sp. MIT S9220]